MIGAGLALSSKTVRNRAAEAAGPAMERAGEMLDGAAERAQALRSEVKDRLASAQSQATGIASDAQRYGDWGGRRSPEPGGASQQHGRR
jgi:hypothetical protein